VCLHSTPESVNFFNTMNEYNDRLCGLMVEDGLKEKKRRGRRIGREEVFVSRAVMSTRRYLSNVDLQNEDQLRFQAISSE
jgi:hypothetical protein